MPIKLARKPETVSQLILRSLDLYRKTFFRVIVLSLVLAIVMFIPRILSIMQGHEIIQRSHELTPDKLWLLALDFFSLLFFSTILWRMHCAIKDAHESLLDDLKRSLKKWPYIIAAAVLQSILMVLVGLAVWAFMMLVHSFNLPVQANSPAILIIMSAFVLQFIFAVYIYFSLYFYIPLILIENKGVLTALKQSAVLVWGNWWRTFSVLIFPWFCYLLFSMVVRFIFNINIHIYFVDPKVAQYTYGGTLFHILIFSLFFPWVASALLVQLRDLELRKKIAVDVNSA